jgi:hypothetical protein
MFMVSESRSRSLEATLVKKWRAAWRLAGNKLILESEGMMTIGGGLLRAEDERRRRLEEVLVVLALWMGLIRERRDE